MQLAKLSLRLLIAFFLTLNSLAAVEAQLSSRKGFSTGKPAKPVGHSIRVDRNLANSSQTSFIVQQDEEDENEKGEGRKDNQSADPDNDKDRVGLDFDDELDIDEEDLDLDYDEDRRPSRPVFGPWPRKGIRGIRIDIRETGGNAPEDVSSQLLESNRSDWTSFRPQQKVFAWVAPDIRYQPLYFEDVALERYGITAGPYHQSLISGFHFAKDFLFLTHKMRHDAPKDCDHPLGFCRPGNSTPYSIQRHYFGRPGR